MYDIRARAIPQGGDTSSANVELTRLTLGGASSGLEVSVGAYSPECNASETRQVATISAWGEDSLLTSCSGMNYPCEEPI